MLGKIILLLLFVTLACLFGDSTSAYSHEQSTTPSTGSCGPLANYVVSPSSGTVELGGTLISGTQCDDCEWNMALPFPVRIYDRVFTTAILEANGTIGFVENWNWITNECLPDFGFEYAIFPHWDDLDMRASVRPSNGIYSSVVGTSPNRVLQLEWRSCLYDLGKCGGTVNFELLLYENGMGFDIVYGEIAGGGSDATVGVQLDYDGPLFSQWSCYTASLGPNLLLSFRQPVCLTPTLIPTLTPTPTFTPTPTLTPTPIPPRCTGYTFTDVCPGDYFFDMVRLLSQRGVISGYNASPPCENPLHIPCFKPFNTITRAQAAKVIVLGARMPISAGPTPHFADVPLSFAFYNYIETAYNAGIISGYACGGSGEPCDGQNRPYFRPFNNVTRAQTTKILIGAFQFPLDTSGGPHFTDVPTSNTFYQWVETAYNLGLISGYADGTFRPNNEIIRGQAAKVVHLADLVPPSTPTQTATHTPSLTATALPTHTATETPTPATMDTVTPTETETSTPVPTDTSTNTPEPTATETPVP